MVTRTLWLVFMCAVATPALSHAQSGAISLTDPLPGSQISRATDGRSLGELTQLALQGNAELRAVRQEIAAARGFLSQAGLRPNPGLDFALGTGRPLGSAGEREFDIGYAHTFELGGKRARRIDVASVGIAIAELQVADEERRLRAEVKRRYADTLAAGRDLEVIGELAELNSRGAAIAQRRVEEGEAAPLERALLQVEVGRLTAERVMAASTGTRALAALKLVAALDLQLTLDIKGDLAAPRVTLTFDEALTRALESRPDLNAARRQEQRAAAEVARARAERVPDVIGLVRYSQTASAFDAFGTTATGQIAPVRDTDHMLAVGVSIPLPFANRNQGNIQAALAQQQAASLRREFAEQSVRADVTAALTQYTAAARALEAFNQDVVAQSEESMKTIRTTYELGEVQLLDVLQEQRRFVETQRAYTQVLKEYFVAHVALEEAIGVELR